MVKNIEYTKEYTQALQEIKEMEPQETKPDEYEVFRNNIQWITDNITDLLVRKRKDYGNSFDKIYEEFGPISVVVRLNDKISRLNNLIKNNKIPKNEPIKDTFLDICGYCVLALRMISKTRKVNNRIF